MQNLTFGEQVKIVLSRKNMTIKELAKKIEVRTKKKMSRQNLTQRLGRDNFQEQDMRMIAEILGCPFQLDILGDSLSAERTEMAETTETLTPETEREERLKIEEPLGEGLKEQTEIRIEEASEEGSETQAGKEPEEALERQSEGQSEGEAEKKGVKASEEAAAAGPGCDSAEKADEEKTAVVSHERDITIGELVDIHEELDAMMEKATSELPKQERRFEKEQREEQPENSYEAAGYDNLALQSEIRQEETAGRDFSVEEGEPIEKLLEEIESMESEDKKEDRQEDKQEDQEEKPHGWKAYLMQRFRKKGKEQSGHNDEPHVERSSIGDKHAGSGYTEGSYPKNTYKESSYAGDGYPENTYEENSYTGDSYSENIYQEDEYSEDNYAQMYEEDGQDAEFVENIYLEEEYLQEIPQEEEEEKGECNPYTGKEYESNSVRMHPSRIGYVQVYDRSNHEWTDMTEWAFLGYQERKKQLLGKDYDPPIYLD